MRHARLVLLALLVPAVLAGACFGQAATAPAAASAPATSGPASVLKPGDRILFIGDSITGLGDRESPNVPKGGGFVQLIRAALKEAHPNDKYELVTLGSSGSTVGAWNNFFARAADPKHKPFFTDVPGNEVKATLARNWDVVVIMLGMNDVLQPAVNDDEKSLAAWTASYAKLIQTVRDRLHPRVIALGECTMATEDPWSAMNKFIEKLNERVAAIAEKCQCLVLLTGRETMFDSLLNVGRGKDPSFRLTYDYVHPNGYGQIEIARSMLKGLSKKEAAEIIRARDVQPLLSSLESKGKIGYMVMQPANTSEGEWTTSSVRFPDQGLRKAKFALSHLTDWRTRLDFNMLGGVGYSCNLNRLKQSFDAEGTISGTRRTQVVTIPAPWLVAAGPIHIYREKQFDDQAARTSVDDAIEAGKDFTSKDLEVAWESTSIADYSVDKNKKGKLTWRRFFPSIDYTGGDAPGNVDFWSISHPRAFETGYAARWVWSEKDRPVRLEASTSGFTGQVYQQVWLNGKKEYSGEIGKVKGMKTEWRTTLKKGWNCTVFRCCHRSYYFQAALEILPVDKDTLEDLRFSVVPKTADSPAPGK